MGRFTQAGEITLSNDTDQSIDTKYGTALDAIFVGVGGDVRMTLSEDSSSVLFKNMIAGTIYSVSPKFIHVTNTTATDIVGLDTGSKYD